MTFQFWRRWLIVVCGGVIIYSATLILLPDTMQDLFNTVFFASPNAARLFGSAASAYIRLVQGVLGAVLIGWMITFIMILTTSFRQHQRSGWYIITVSTLIWYSIDTVFSLVIGVPAHALFNTIFLVLFTIPLAATGLDLHKNASEISV